MVTYAMACRWNMFVVTCLLWSRSLAMKTEDRPNYKNHSCIRPCEVGQTMVCEYDFYLEYYSTMSMACKNCPFNRTDCYSPECIHADGVERAVMVVNRMMPGPAIHVCQGDTVQVTVHNGLQGMEGTSIHWHGVYQAGSQFMDGVAMITQCPIIFKTSFQYRFIAENAGTHYWHAHSGFQREDGIFGALIVRQPPDLEPHLGLYTEDLPEHTVIVTDWIAELDAGFFPAIHFARREPYPTSMLINGKGGFRRFTDETNTTLYTPYAVFAVEQGKKYRFRVISNGAINCPIQFAIDNHNLTVIATDGNPVEMMEVESFNIMSGERYDFVLHASAMVGNYWLRIRGENLCDHLFANQVAVVHYLEANMERPQGSIGWTYAGRQGKKLNINLEKESGDQLQVTSLTSLQQDTYDDALRLEADKKLYMTLDAAKKENHHFSETTLITQIDDISSVFPPAPPLSQLEDIPENTFCSSHTLTAQGLDCAQDYCECTHRLLVDLGDVVELILIDKGTYANRTHPMHLHGHQFRVIGMDKLGDVTTLAEIMDLDQRGLLIRNLTKAVAKDTVIVPDGGYTIIRFHANNPGIWLFHCHLKFHFQLGMWLLIQVGKEMPKVPTNFPRCPGHWHFVGYPEDSETTGSTTCGAVTTEPLARVILFTITLFTISIRVIDRTW